MTALCGGLPDDCVREVLLSGEYPFFAKKLRQYGVSCVYTKPCLTLAEPVQSHADMQCFVFDEKTVFVPRELSYLQQLFLQRGYTVLPTENALTDTYPGDILCNVLRMGNTVFAHKYADPAILRFCAEQGLSVQTVKQGYCRCSVCVLSETAAITADVSLAAAMRRQEMDVLLLSPGDILLPGYAYGFIGGCCGMPTPDRLLFTGDLSIYRQGEAVYAFLRQHGITPLFLSDGPLIDIGGIVPLR